MKKSVWAKARLIFTITGLFFFLSVFSPLQIPAGEVQDIRQQLESMKEQMRKMQEKLEKLEKQGEEIAEIDERLNKAELHTATDKLSFGVEMRTKLDSIHYTDIRVSPADLTNRFFDNYPGDEMMGMMGQMMQSPMMQSMMTADMFLDVMKDPGVFSDMLTNMMSDPDMQQAMMQDPVMSQMMQDPNMPAMLEAMGSMGPMGFSGATLDQAQAMMNMMKDYNLVPDAEKRDADNDMAFTTKVHLNMKSKINRNLDFGGRLAVYKAWGDSTGVKFNNGSLGDVTLDGNTTSLPHGDMLRLERAYFNLKGGLGSVPVNFSLGRRPSTYGPPLEYGNYSMEGGSPLAHIINWQFDGASLNFGLEDATGIPGAAFKLCYGVGFESGWGNSYSLNSKPDVEDVNLFGFITTLYDDDLYSAVFNYAHAGGISDGFTGLTVMPFIISENNDGTYNFSQNAGGFITRMQPSTELGDWDAATLLLRANFSELFGDVDMFLSGAWSHTDADRISENAFYKIMGQGLLSSDGKLEKHDGYSIYAGVRFPMPGDGKLGLEYNWGSQYWFNFSGAEDSLVGSKLATRGSVYEGYYIQPFLNDSFFLKLGGQYYDYEYTGSGNPLGKPVKIDDATAFDAFNAVIDKVWIAYLSATIRF